MAAVIYSQTLQWRLSVLANLRRKAGERTALVVLMEDTIREYVGKRIDLRYFEETGEYGLFSSNEPQDPTIV